MTKPEIIEKLTELNIEHDESSSKAELEALLPKEGSDDAEDVGDGITVGNPMKLRPVELPLVVTLPSGSSKAQIAFAKVLNAYAYQNPEKWETKKDVLIERLKSLKNAPDPVESNIKVGGQGGKNRLEDSGDDE